MHTPEWLQEAYHTIEKRLPSSTQLLQAEDLRVAQDVQTDILSNSRLLFQMYELGRSLTQEIGSNGLAFTQIPALFYRDYLLPETRKVIYLASDTPTLGGELLINPIVRTHKDTNHVLCMEACGSIDNGKRWMIIARPKKISLSSVVYSPYHPLRSLNVEIDCQLTASLLDHEYDHLLGKTALDRPQHIVDFRNFSFEDWHRSDSCGETIEKVFTTVLRNGIRDWIVPSDNGFARISLSHNQVRNFLNQTVLH